MSAMNAPPVTRKPLLSRERVADRLAALLGTRARREAAGDGGFKSVVRTEYALIEVTRNGPRVRIDVYEKIQRYEVKTEHEEGVVQEIAQRVLA